MTLIFENESNTELDLPLEELAELVIYASLDELGCPYEAEISLLITDDEQIQELNRNFRQIDRATDVLSFPMNDYEIPGNFDFLEDGAASADCFDPETGELLMGDIVINAGRVISQAEEFGHSQKREYAFLITHSMIHLCGYDHMEPEEAAMMEDKQRSILEKLGILR